MPNSTSQNKPQPRRDVSSIGLNALYRGPTIRRRDSMQRSIFRVGWNRIPALSRYLKPISLNNIHSGPEEMEERLENNKSRWLLLAEIGN